MNKQLSKIRKTMQNMKEEFNKETEILKKNKNVILEMKLKKSNKKVLKISLVE
jgi:hypothetical protein